MSQPLKTTLFDTKTTACYIGDTGKPPIMTPGDLTPELLANFENGCYAYFSMNDIDNNKQVSKIAWGLQDARVQVWYRTNHEKVNKDGFKTFMKSVRTQ